MVLHLCHPSDQPDPDPWPSSTLGWTQALFPPGGKMKRFKPWPRKHQEEMMRVRDKRERWSWLQRKGCGSRLTGEMGGPPGSGKEVGGPSFTCTALWQAGQVLSWAGRPPGTPEWHPRCCVPPPARPQPHPAADSRPSFSGVSCCHSGHKAQK